MELFVILVAYVADFLLTAFCVWACFGLLGVLGITSIGTFALVFSWKCAFVIWLIVIILRVLFRTSKKD